LRRGPDRLGFTPGTAALSASPQIYSPRAGSGRTPAWRPRRSCAARARATRHRYL